MKTICKTFIAAIAAISPLFHAFPYGVTAENIDIRKSGGFLSVNADLVLDSLRLSADRQVFITPLVRTPGTDGADSISAALPSVLVNGRNMHFSYLRGILRNAPAIKAHDIIAELRRDNGHPQRFPYSARIPLEDWMRGKDTRVVFIYDSCGCGVAAGRAFSEETILFENPVKEMQAVMIVPPIVDVPVEIHEGRARVQFEVDRTELHVDPYRCRNGQLIDNRAQIQMIDDSVRYALTDPNVELAGIEICGYASPESPYLHNYELATGRSRALAEYLADRYHLPKGSVKYSAVTENWGEFRTEAATSNEISEEQRALLLELIEAPAETPDEFDAKEKMLKTDPRYSNLYKTKILPEWFPRLRATTFAIHTRLKELDDEELAKVIESTPEKMSLNQMYRVARLYPEGSDEFNRVIETALRFYPKDPTAIINAATAAVDRGDYARAKQLLSKVDNVPEVCNLLGIIATAEERYDSAERYFEKAGGNANAERNLELLR